MKKKIPKTVKINKATMSQREADDTAHSELMARARETSDHKEEVVQDRFVALPTYDDHVHAASSFAMKAGEAFEASENARDNASKVVEWQRTKVLTQLSIANAMAAHAIAGQN